MFDLEDEPKEFSRGYVSNPLLDPPATPLKRLLKGCALAVLGALLGLLPCVLLISMATGHIKLTTPVIATIVLISCGTPALVFFILGYIGKGSLIHRMLEWLGKAKARGI